MRSFELLSPSQLNLFDPPLPVKAPQKGRAKKIPAIERLAKLTAPSKAKCKKCKSHCIEYVGKAIDHHKGGYARIQGDDGRIWQAHALAWTHRNGPVPKGMILMHLCDNPRCCNPDHMKIGTHKENAEHKMKNGRAGKIAGKDKAISIAEFFLGNPGIDMSAISAKFQISVRTAINITTGRAWSKHTGIEFVPAKPHQRTRATLH